MLMNISAVNSTPPQPPQTPVQTRSRERTEHSEHDGDADDRGVQASTGSSQTQVTGGPSRGLNVQA